MMPSEKSLERFSPELEVISPGIWSPRMLLREHLEKTGNRLFSWRSYFSVVCFGVIFAALRNFRLPYGSHQLERLWEILCLLVSLSGLAVRIATVGCVPGGTSGRNSSRQKAALLNTTGMYSVVRHPLYLGNLLILLGLSLFPKTWWLTVILLLAFWLCYERIIFAEEEFLKAKFGQNFVDWAAQTPALFARFRLWKPPALSFSMRTVLRREHSTLFLIIVSFTIMKQMAALLTTGTLDPDKMWLTLLALGLAQYLLLRHLKKHTRLLRVAGR